MFDETLERLRKLSESSLQALLVEDPGNLPARFALGERHLESGRLEEAVREFQATSAAPGLAAASHDRLGRAYSFLPGPGMMDRAIDEFRRGLSVPGLSKRDLFELRYDLASLLCLLGRLREALVEVEEIVRIDSCYRDVANWLERLHAETGGPGGGPSVPAAPRPPGPGPLHGGAARPWPPEED